MRKNLSTLILIGIIAVVAVGAASIVFTNYNEGDQTFKVTYYQDGDKISEAYVPADSTLITADDIVKVSSGRFAGWNTKKDMTGTIIPPGTSIKVHGDMQLYAIVLDSGIFMIVLPEEQDGFDMSADQLYVANGGFAIVLYSVWPSHIDDDLVITVNGNPTELDSMKRIYLRNITEDQIITVSGVLDRREHNINLPKQQTGYILTSTETRVHHGETYTLEYTLLPGYRETSDFGIRLNGGDARFPSGETLVIEDVKATHNITVTGVEAIQYRVSSGKNISAMVRGVAASTATVEDIVTIQLAAGYTMPATFEDHIIGKFTNDRGGYRIAGDIVFPSVLEVTAGDNTVLDGPGQRTVFVCAGDTVKVSASSGYALPENYANAAADLKGVTYSDGRYSFSDDTALPSVYKVIFNGFEKVHATYFVIGGTTHTFPQNNPDARGYDFDRWDVDSQYVVSDLLIKAIWIPITHNVYFGPNLSVKIGNDGFGFYNNSAMPSRTVQIKTDEKIIIKTTFLEHPDLPNDYMSYPLGTGVFYKDGYFQVYDDCEFPGVTMLRYIDMEKTEYAPFIVTIGLVYDLFIPTKLDEKEFTIRWTLEGNIIPGRTIYITEDEVYFIRIEWVAKMDNF